MKGRVTVAVAGALVAALAATGLASAGPASKSAVRTVVPVAMYEMGFKLGKRVVPPGVVVFRVVNDGSVEHDFRIRGAGTPMLASGQRATLAVRFPKAGRFTFVCTAEGHAAAGMVGKLIVRQPKS